VIQRIEQLINDEKYNVAKNEINQILDKDPVM
jgi:hypothetical protein